jgi:hypothetical protein
MAYRPLSRRLAGLLALLAFPTLAAAADPVPLRLLDGGLLAAPVRIGDRVLWMLVDTGATRSRVSADVARQLDLTPRARYVLQTAEGVAECVCGGPVAARVGDSILVIDCLGWSVGDEKAALRPGVAGVLGADALAGRSLLLDPVRRRLVLDPPIGELAGEVVSFTLEQGRPTLTLPIAAEGGVGPPSLRLVLDSAADALILFGPAAGVPRGRGQVDLATSTGTVRAAFGAAPRLVGLRRTPRQAVLLPEVTDRGEDGLLPLAAIGAVALDWERGVAVLNARPRD